MLGLRSASCIYRDSEQSRSSAQRFLNRLPLDNQKTIWGENCRGTKQQHSLQPFWTVLRDSQNSANGTRLSDPSRVNAEDKASR